MSFLIVGWVLVMLIIGCGAIGDRLPECDCDRAGAAERGRQ